MKIYVLTIVDLRNVGFNAKDVEVFTDKGKASARMYQLYNDFAKDYGIEDPFDGEGGITYDFNAEGYAYVFGEYYLDIFEKEIEV